jgi:hypothetical protein
VPAGGVVDPVGSSRSVALEDADHLAHDGDDGTFDILLRDGHTA